MQKMEKLMKIIKIMRNKHNFAKCQVYLFVIIFKNMILYKCLKLI